MRDTPRDVTRGATLVPLCALDDVNEGAIRLEVLPDGRRLALYNLEGEIFATDDTCTHGQASLAEDGAVEGDMVECAWHGGRFKIKTGEACAMPCSDPLKSWPLRVVDGRVYLVE